MKKTAFVTGATSGFGKAIAKKFAEAGYKVIINGRRADRLQSLAEELTQKYLAPVHIASFDVRDKDAVFKAVEAFPSEFQYVDVLVNNAGLALGRDYFEDARIEDWEIMIDTNVKGLLYVTRAVLPKMVERSSGHIINIGSVAGKEVYEKGNVYCGTKHAVTALSEAMRIDLLKNKIKVTAIHPGAANTEFSAVRFKGNMELAESVYKGYDPLKAEDIADIVLYCVSLPERVVINDLVVTALAQANSFYFLREE